MKRASEDGGRGGAARVRDELEDRDLETFDGILEMPLDGEKPDEVFRECITDWEKDEMLAREKEILNVLSMAGENENGETVRNLTEELIDIQKKLDECNR